MAARTTREIREAYLRGLRIGLEEVVDDFIDESTKIIEAEAVDTGTLKNSVQVTKPAKLERVVTWTAGYAAYVHYGTRPHWPPLAPILAWVRRNLRTVIKSSGERELRIKPTAATRSFKAPGVEVERVARAIQAKIARDGTDPVPWVPKALSRVKPRMARIMQASIDREVSK